MPFTFSHPAIVLPFFRTKNWSLTGLIIGSMAPDFEFFFRMRTQSEISHTFHGLFILDLPLAIIVTLLFYGVLKNPIIDNTPHFVQSRLVELRELNWFNYFKKNTFMVMASFLVGAMSHFLWDSLTHWDGFVVQRVAFLNSKLLSFALFDWIQYLSSIFGLMVLWQYFMKIPQEQIRTGSPSKTFWLLTIVVAIIVIYFRFTIVEGWHRIADIIIGVLSSVVVGLTISSVVHLKFKRA